ncbi:MAG: disulfide bond formation protein B [Rickettsiales bacterium]|jgi:disulfide bond formation protein DsbB|nr:disulfide bond formation protein B [Rickettsiales bacterium]
MQKNHYLKLSFLLAVGLISAVFILQYGFNILPCKLCLLQRYPYYLMLLCLSILYSFRLHKFDKYFLYLVTLCFFATSAIALYHSLVELGYITTQLHCASSSLYNNLEDMQNSIIGRPAVSCDAAAFKILYLSLSNWNCLFALSCSILGGRIIIKNN